MDTYEKRRSSSHSPRSPLSPGSFRFDVRPKWRQNRVCCVLEGLGTLVFLRLRSLIIIALLLIITSGVLKLKPVRYSSDHGDMVVLSPTSSFVWLNFFSCPLNILRQPSTTPWSAMDPLNPTSQSLQQKSPFTSSSLRRNRTLICAKPSSPAPSLAIPSQ